MQGTRRAPAQYDLHLPEEDPVLRQIAFGNAPANQAAAATQRGSAFLSRIKAHHEEKERLAKSPLTPSLTRGGLPREHSPPRPLTFAVAHELQQAREKATQHERSMARMTQEREADFCSYA